MSERGAWSQVSVAFEPRMAEGRRRKNERAFPSEEKREGKSKKSAIDSRGPCSPTRGASYIGEGRERGRGVVYARQVCGGGGGVFFSHNASRCPCLLLLLHVVVDGVFWCT
jgi:hypothetical protein